MIRVGVLGATGRMGRWVTQLLQSEYAGKALVHAQAGSKDSVAPLLETDLVIDFSSPAGTRALTDQALKHSGALPAILVGTTGWKADELHKLEELAKKTPVLMSSNFSTGVMALLDILKQASPVLEKLGYTPVIVETHHQHKKDAPSGTALMLQRAIAPETPAGVQTHAVRAGEIIGDHEVTFYGPGDHLSLGHFAQDRSIFARGAIDVGLWLAATQRKTKAQGLISIQRYFEELKK